MSLTKMSRKTQIPISTLYERIKSYKAGLIKKHTAIIDFSQLGFTARAKVLLRVDKDDRAGLKGHLMASPFTNGVFKVNNGFDFLVEFIFRNMKELEEHLEYLQENFNLKDTKAFYIIDELKEEDFLSKSQK
jgi:DNA-binding Lrp family transcriptional regulator